MSPIFVVPKPDGTHRLMINLKKFNEFLPVEHFKIEDYRTVCYLMQRNSFMAVVDSRDAYHSVPIYKQHRKFLRFSWDGQLYQYNCLCFGLSLAPRVFTKILKPLLSHLRSHGVVIVGYLDDLLIMGRNADECARYVSLLCSWLARLGFVINEKKSQLIPAQK